MEFSKPKVTIDLAEYNELISYKEQFHESELSDYETALKVTLQCVPASIYASLLKTVFNRLENIGLCLIIQSFDNQDTVHAIVKKKKNDKD